MSPDTLKQSVPPPLSSWIKSIEGSPTMALNAQAMALRRQGKDILNLAAGEPDFDTPEHIRAAAHKAHSTAAQTGAAAPPASSTAPSASASAGTARCLRQAPASVVCAAASAAAAVVHCSR